MNMPRGIFGYLGAIAALCLAAVFLSQVTLVPEAKATSPGPILFYTDIYDGPATGNSDPTFSSNGGAYVTLYGNFLTGFTSVKLNGASCLVVVSNPAAYLWYQRMVVQLTSGCTTGNFSITTPNGTWSGPTLDNVGGVLTADFTVVTKPIRYVATNGNDSTGTGSFSAPWATMAKAVENEQPNNGEINYAENGVATVPCQDNGGWGGLTIRKEWSQAPSDGWPSAMLGYPGATATVGKASCANGAIRMADCTATGGAPTGYWVLGELTAIDSTAAIIVTGPSSGGDCQTVTGQGGQFMRFVAIDGSCPTGSGSAGCLHTAAIGPTAGGKRDNWFLGLNWHRIGQTPTNTDQYHGMYYGDNSRGYEVAWGRVQDVVGCRGIQIYSNYGNEGNFTVHDMEIWAVDCSGLDMATSDPSIAGGIQIYNNVLIRPGQGPPTTEGGGWFPGIAFFRAQQSGTGATGTFYGYFNTIFDAGEVTPSPSANCPDVTFAIGLDNDTAGGPNGTQVAVIQNNIAYNLSKVSPCTAGIPYFANGLGSSTVSGTNNLFFGNGTGGSPTAWCGSTHPCTSANITASVTTDPSFVSTSEAGCPNCAATNLHLSSAASPANGAGSLTGLAGVVPAVTLLYDHDGQLRPTPPSIGAFEFAPGSGGVVGETASWQTIAVVTANRTAAQGSVLVCPHQ